MKTKRRRREEKEKFEIKVVFPAIHGGGGGWRWGMRRTNYQVTLWVRELKRERKARGKERIAIKRLIYSHSYHTLWEVMKLSSSNLFETRLS